MKKTLILIIIICMTALTARADGPYQWSVRLTNYISKETGKAPNAYLWIPENCQKVRAVIVAQQNMTEEALFKMESFRKQLTEMQVALVWVAPGFCQNWDPSTPCQSTFDEMMAGLAQESNHPEIEKAPVIPFGHSAQATFPWNFAAWNNDRALCILSYHGDAPRTNLCGYGRDNIEWGRHRNIDGIPGLMIEGEYEWWEARVTPALAFRMMYPGSCVSFLCDAGSGHFDLCEATADYIALFIKKALEQRLQADGSLRRLNPEEGWLAARYDPDIAQTDGTDKTAHLVAIDRAPFQRTAAPYAQYQCDRHDAFWYFDQEMAELTESRYAETLGKKEQAVGATYQGQFIAYNEKEQGGMTLRLDDAGVGTRFTLTPLYTDLQHQAPTTLHGKGRLHVEYVSGALRKVGENTFEIVPCETIDHNPRRSCNARVVVVGEGDDTYKRVVQSIGISWE